MGKRQFNGLAEFRAQVWNGTTNILGAFRDCIAWRCNALPEFERKRCYLRVDRRARAA